MLIGNIIKKLREYKGLTQEELGSKLNLSRTTISMYENNQRDPDTKTLSLMADLFGVSSDYLLGKPFSNSELEEMEALKRALKRAGYMDEDEDDLTDEEFNRLIGFIKANKNFIKEGK